MNTAIFTSRMRPYDVSRKALDRPSDLPPRREHSGGDDHDHAGQRDRREVVGRSAGRRDRGRGPMNASAAEPAEPDRSSRRRAACRTGTARSTKVPVEAWPASPGVAAIATPSGTASAHHHQRGRHVLRTTKMSGSTASKQHEPDLGDVPVAGLRAPSARLDVWNDLRQRERARVRTLEQQARDRRDEQHDPTDPHEPRRRASGGGRAVGSRPRTRRRRSAARCPRIRTRARSRRARRPFCRRCPAPRAWPRAPRVLADEPADRERERAVHRDGSRPRSRATSRRTRRCRGAGRSATTDVVRGRRRGAGAPMSTWSPFSLKSCDRSERDLDVLVEGELQLLGWDRHRSCSRPGSS